MQSKWLLFVVPLAMSVTNVHCSSELVPAPQAAHSPTVSDSSPGVQSLFSVMAGVVCLGRSLLFGWNRRGRSAEQVPDKFENASLHQAVECGQVEIVGKLLDAGASIETVNGDGRTPLMCAACAGKPEAMKMLLRHGADIEALGGLGKTVLMLMAGEGKIGLVKLLLDAGAKVDATAHSGLSPLMFAAWHGHVEVVRVLLGAGAAIDAITNVKGTDGPDMTSLLWAARSGKEAIVRELLLRGAIFPGKEEMAKLEKEEAQNILERNRESSHQHRAAAIGALEKLPIDLQNIVLNQMGHQRMREQERYVLAQLMMRKAEE